MNPTFSGEVQLAGWSESHNGGCKVTFWLAESSDLDAFRAMTVRKGNTAGQRLACVLVEIGDDEQPVQAQGKPNDGEPAEPLGPLAMWAVQRCRDGLFRTWLAKRFQTLCMTEGAARELILHQVGIDSRRKLDTDVSAGRWFKQQFMEPYSAWLKAQGVAA
jgi:hypothetical protein